MSFTVGDVVKLKSGGPLMTVLSIDEAAHRVVCQWFDKSEARQAEFPPETLRAAQSHVGAISVSRGPSWGRSR